MRYFLFFASVCFLIGCAPWQQRPLSFDDLSSNPNASLAFFTESNLSQEMRLEYAMALQDAGLYNFETEIISEDQIEEGIGIRLTYKEEKVKFRKAPTLVLQSEFFKNGQLWNKFTIVETSDKIINTPRGMKSEIKFRQKVLLKRFLEETKRLQSEEQLENNNA